MYPAFNKFVPLVKVEETTDEAGKKSVIAYGISTAQKPDADGEICVYLDTKPQYEAWAAEALKATQTAGQELSLGNIRLQHSLEIAGKAIAIDFKDTEQEIWLKSQAVDDRIGDMLKGGFVTGYSHAGGYLYRKCAVCKTDIDGTGNYCPACKKINNVLYAAKISEVSFVDKPCLGVAHFTFVKSDKSIELRKFAQQKDDTTVKTKQVAGEDLAASAFLIVGSEDDTKTWKLPVKFSTTQKTKTHVRNALARFTELKDVDETVKAQAWTKLNEIAKELGIETTEKAYVPTASSVFAMFKAAKAEAQKGMYQVATFARLLDDISYLRESATYERDYEGDDSTIPEDLLEEMKGLATVFLAMAEEEANELTAAAKAAKGANNVNEELLKAARKGMASHFKKAAGHQTKIAAMHEKMAEFHGKCMDKADVGDDEKAMHKAQKSFHEGMHKACVSYGSHLETMAGTQDEDGQKSAAAVVTLEKSMTAEGDETQKPAPAGGGEGSASLFEKAMADGIADFQKSDQFKEMLKAKVANMAKEALGLETVPTAVKIGGTQLVDRNGKDIGFGKAAGGATEVDQEATGL